MTDTLNPGPETIISQIHKKSNITAQLKDVVPQDRIKIFDTKIILKQMH